MRLLFASSTLSLCALSGVVIAAARHICASRSKAITPIAQQSLGEVHQAGELRTPRSLHLVHSAAQRQTPRQAAQLGYIPSDPHNDSRKQIAQAVLLNRRKAPQSVRPALAGPGDWALYNKNLGERTDPSTLPLCSATAASGSSLNRA